SAGDRLQSERELAEQFGVSRITVRDALRVLEARGLIRVKVAATGGAFVADANTDWVAEPISTLIRPQRLTLSELAEARSVVVAHLEDFEKRLRKRLAEREEERLPTGNVHRLIRQQGKR